MIRASHDRARVLRAILLAAMAGLCLDATESAAKPPPEVERLQLEAKRLFQKGLYVDAARTFERGFARYPARGALFNAGVAYQRGKDSVSAVRVLRRFQQVSQQAGKRDARTQEAAQILARLRAKLAKTHVRLRLTVAPPEAVVTVGTQRYVGALADEIWLVPGPHTVAVSADRYVPASITVEARRGQGLARELRLRPASRQTTGRLIVETRPAGALVQVDGRPVGRAPLTSEVAAGAHAVTATAPGFVTLRQKVSVGVGQEKTLALALVPTQAAATPAAEPPAVYERWWFWTTIGVAVAGGVTAAVLLSADGAGPTDAPSATHGLWNLEAP